MLRLATVRSHDQFNTTIYSYNDRYRGVKGDRMIVFINAEDRAARGLDAGVAVALETISADGIARRRSEEHTSELQSLMRISYAGFCSKKRNETPHSPTMYTLCCAHSLTSVYIKIE